ncbi:MAG TPA: enolase C-terminal domain-like protein [Candidatus Limnocylindrales bacterium]|nr:enolase C-terminal domain-like protein [Candidatus Limnocylindrales bacterium]
MTALPDVSPARQAAGIEVEDLVAAAYSIPTDRPESDGTLAWNSTTIVVVQVTAGPFRGLGYSYAHPVAAEVAATTLARVVVGRDVADVPGAWAAMVGAVRNVGRQGIAATAISAVDTALWDLKARWLGLPLVELLGAVRAAIPAYGSGGFCSYDDETLADQLGGWAEDGFRFVKMKVGREPARDPHRTDVARAAIGPDVELFVDANGAHDRSHALAAAAAFAERGVTWFEEPVSSDDLAGLRLVRDRAPAGMAIAAGEYGWDAFALRALLEAGAVDVLQADATRCLGSTGYLTAAALCEAWNVRLSSHCAPSLHATLQCAVRPAVHLEWFHDHVRLEQLLFDGAVEARDGEVRPDRSRSGLGLELKVPDADPYLVWRSR